MVLNSQTRLPSFFLSFFLVNKDKIMLKLYNVKTTYVETSCYEKIIPFVPQNYFSGMSLRLMR